MIGSQAQRPFSPSSTSEHQGQKLCDLPGVFIKLYKKSFKQFPQKDDQEEEKML